jgi:type II secretory pathway component PulK
MRAFIGMALLAMAAACLADDQGQAIQRALIQRDQQSAEFATRGVEARRAMENLNANQLRDAGLPLSPDPVIARELLPYQRQTMARERMMLPPIDQPAKFTPPPQALPLPGSGGPPSIVVPISVPSIGG